MAFKKTGVTFNSTANEWMEHYECDYEWERANLPTCNPGSTVKVLSTGKEYSVGNNGIWGGGSDIEDLIASGQIGSEGKKSFSSAFTPSPTEFAKFPDDVKMPEGVIGMTANVKFAGEGYYFLNNPKENRDEDYYFSFNSNDTADPDFWFIANNTNSGMLNKRSFGIGGNVSKVCPTFWLNYPEYTNIAYFYEPTSDNLGLGMTVPAGWFALNTTTFALTPFDLINNPIIVPSDFAPVTTNGNAGMDFIKANWFELKKEISFVIKEKNLLIYEGIGNVCFADISALWDVNDEIAAKLGTTCVFVFHESSTDSGRKWLLLLPETVEYITLTYSGGIKPIDPKYLPGLTLPVLEISEATAMGTLGTGTATVTAEEAAFLDRMAQAGAPFMVSVKAMGMATTCLCQYGKDTGGESYSGCIFGINTAAGVPNDISLQTFLFVNGSGTWQTFYISKNVS